MLRNFARFSKIKMLRVCNCLPQNNKLYVLLLKVMTLELFRPVLEIDNKYAKRANKSIVCGCVQISAILKSSFLVAFKFKYLPRA